MSDKETRGKLGLVFCNSGKYFGEKVKKELHDLIVQEKGGINGVSVVNTNEVHFKNGEIKTVINDSIRGHDIYIFQDVENKTEGLSVNDNLMALKTVIDSCKRSGARHITVILPAFPYSRQDKNIEREGITSSFVGKELEDLGAEAIITLDVHNTAIAGFFRKATLENLKAIKRICDYIKENNEFDLNNLVVIGPDMGGVTRARDFAKRLKIELALIYKKRDYNQLAAIEEARLLGNVEGKDVLIVDDIIDTGGTLIKEAELLKIKFGCRRVYAACSLPMFNGDALENINEAYNKGYINGVIGTDVIYHGCDFKEKYKWFKEVSLARYFAWVIFNMNNYISLSKLLK